MRGLEHLGFSLKVCETQTNTISDGSGSDCGLQLLLLVLAAETRE